MSKIRGWVTWVWTKIKAIHFGYAMVFAFYTIALYFHLLKLLVGDMLGFKMLKSPFLEAVVLYVALVFIVHLMRKHSKV
jgi:hypothetical protein